MQTNNTSHHNEIPVGVAVSPHIMLTKNGLSVNALVGFYDNPREDIGCYFKAPQLLFYDDRRDIF